MSAAAAADVAQCTEVTEPCSVVSIRRVRNGLARLGTRRQMSEATTPGCSAYALTPVTRRASSRVNSTLHSLDAAYSRCPVKVAVRRRAASKSMPAAA